MSGFQKMQRQLQCQRICDDIFNPEEEYAKLLRTKPIVNKTHLFKDLHMPQRFQCPYLYRGYGQEQTQNPMYRTVNSEYGYFAPNDFTIPTRYFPKSQKFSNEKIKSGMYRNFSLNTQMDSVLY